MNTPTQNDQNGLAVKEKQILIIKKGLSFLTIQTKNIAFIYTIKDITYIVDKEGRKYSYSQNLNKLEEELDHRFFRANRQYIINVYFIRSFRSQDKSKLVVEMMVAGNTTQVPISQITAPKFKEWISSF